jgi:hypothetical protein
MLVAALCFLAGNVAQAEDVGTGGNATQSVRHGAVGHRPPLQMSLLLETDTLMSGSPERNYYDIEMSGRLRAEFLERLTVDLSLGVIHGDIELFTPDDVALDATLEIPWQATIGGRASVVLYRWPFLDISLYAELTVPITPNETTIRSLTFYDDLALLGMVSLDDIGQWVTVNHVWYRAEFGLQVRGILGRWRPFLDIKYVHLPGRLDLNLDESLNSLISLLGVQPPTSFDASFQSVYYALGFEVELGYGFEIEMRVAASPTLHGGWVFVGRLLLEVPLTARPRQNWGSMPRRRCRPSR